MENEMIVWRFVNERMMIVSSLVGQEIMTERWLINGENYDCEIMIVEKLVNGTKMIIS